MSLQALKRSEGMLSLAALSWPSESRHRPVSLCLQLWCVFVSSAFIHLSLHWLLSLLRKTSWEILLCNVWNTFWTSVQKEADPRLASSWRSGTVWALEDFCARVQSSACHLWALNLSFFIPASLSVNCAWKSLSCRTRDTCDVCKSPGTVWDKLWYFQWMAVITKMIFSPNDSKRPSHNFISSLY